MQAEALAEVGVEPTPSNLALLRSAALEHPELALYVLHNSCRDGKLCLVGEAAPHVRVCTPLDPSEVTFPPGDLPIGIPLVVLAGSTS